MRFPPRPNQLTGPAIILLAALIAVAPLFLRGPSCSSDFIFHLVTWIDAKHSMSSGILYPHWASSANFGAGEPKFIFYPPISWMCGAVLGMLLPWGLVPQVFFVLLLAATGLANRALARMTLADGPATLAGCASIFVGYALFCIYERNDFGDSMGGFWIPLLLLFALRRQSPSGNFWERSFDGSATPLALVIAGIWLSNGPLGIMASYLLLAVALVSALIEKSLVPVVRAVASTFGGMALASLYLVPAVVESKWASIQVALVPIEYKVENNWLFGLSGDPHATSHAPLLNHVSVVAVVMLVIAFAGGIVAWMRGVVPGERKWWLPIALIPPVILFLLLPVSRLVWNTLPEFQLLQFPWRWLVILEAPMAICFASAVWSDRRLPRIAAIAACAAVFVGISFAAPHWWFALCGSQPASLQEAVREGIGFIGKPEYTIPGIRRPLVDFQLDSQGNLLADSEGNPILHVLPDACLLDNSPETSVQGETGAAPAWRGESAHCNSTGWQELRLVSDTSGAAATDYLPEQKWFRGIAAHAGYAILRLRYYPAWAVKVNGVPVTGVAERERGLMAVPVPKGNVLISADWTTSGDVVAGRWMSGAALLLLTCLFLFERKRLRAPLDPDKSNPLVSSVRVDRRKTSSGQQAKNATRKKVRKPGRSGG